MRRLFSNKIFVIVLVTLILIAFIVFSAIPGSPLSNVTKPLSVIIDPVQSVFKKAGSKISDFYAAIAEGMEIRKENEELREEIAELEYKIQQGEEAKLRWEELKSAFSIQDTFENYHIYGASVLTRESDDWFSVIRINVGEKDDFDSRTTSYAVVDARMNLVGRVMVTDDSSSKVLPLLHEGFSVSAKVNVVNGAIVLVTGDITLKNDGLCLITRIPSNVVLHVGDELVTSGEGGLFPAGIPIGVIESFDESDPEHPMATLRPYASVGDIKDVFIMVPTNGEKEETDTSESSTETTTAPDISETPANTEATTTAAVPAESGETTLADPGDTEL
ncbi:MAG: rod shape-determining protein MreC [Clostridiales bacterium]|nr:rod shape-determining protein MreC [Clostridiales bacterium]